MRPYMNKRFFQLKFKARLHVLILLMKIFVALMLSFNLLACATLLSSGDSMDRLGGPHEAKDGVYYESAFNDLNKPPKKFEIGEILNNQQLQKKNQQSGRHHSDLTDSNGATASVEGATNSRFPASQDGGGEAHSMFARTQADYHFAAGEAFSYEGKAHKAIESFKTVLMYDPDSSTVHLRLATEYARGGQLSEALDYAKSAARLTPKKTDPILLLGSLYSAMKLFDQAILEYQKVLKLDAKNTEAPIYLGALYAEKKEYAKAAANFQILVKNPEYENKHLAHYYLAKINSEQKQHQAAQKHYLEALKLKPDFTEAAMALGQSYAQQGDSKKAIELYKKFQSENGPSLRMAEILSQSYLEEESYELALEQLKFLEELGEDVLAAKVQTALVLIDLKRYDEAITKLKETLALEPQSDKIRFYLAAVYEEIKENEKAITEFLKVPTDSSFFVDSRIHAALLEKEGQATKKAVDIIEKAIEQKMDSPQLYTLLATLLDELGEHEKSYQMLTEALKILPEQVQLMFYMGAVSDRLKKPQEVVKWMKEVIARDPNHVQAINYLAYTYAEQGIELKEAEGLARKAQSLAPEDGFILDTLGWVLYRQGRFNDALPLLEAAQKMQPQESIIAEHLGDVYRALRLDLRAKDMYQLAIENELDKNAQERIKDKISSILIQKEVPIGEVPDNMRVPASSKASSPTAIQKQ